MVFQYESLVGHLFVVSGRALSAAPPGALVEVAPKTAARGRAADTFYVLVLPSGEPTTAVFYEQLAELAAERYFESSGSVTAGLRAVYDTINRNLMDHNRLGDRAYEVNMVCAVLHDSNLILSRCGLGMAVLATADDLSLFPTDPLNDEDLVFGPPLGVQSVPDVKLKQMSVAEGTRLVLSDADLAEVDREALREAVRSETLPVLLHRLRMRLVDRATVMVAEFVPPNEQVNLLTPEGNNSRQVLVNPLPPEKQLENIDIDPDIGTRLIDVATEVRDRTQQGLSATSKGIARGAEVTNGLIDHYFGGDGEKSWWAGAVGMGIAVGIPLVVVGLVITLWVFGLDRSEYEDCVAQVQEGARTARSIDSSDPNGMLSAWNAVLLKIGECDQIRPETLPDENVRTLEREGQRSVDRILNIDRREVNPLISLPSARLTQAELRGLSLYVLDDANGYVYQIELSSDGQRTESYEAIPRMYRGAPVDQFEIGEIIDIAWAEDGNALSQSNVLVALDENGVLVEHSPTILTRGVQRLLGTENWVDPVAITLWRGNLYVLDPGANQIWRYEAGGGSYQGLPTEYFAGQTRPNIRDAVDFAIDESGRVYVLFGGGEMGLYRSGQVEPFGLVNFPPGQELTNANALYFSTSPISQQMYVSSQPNRTIYAFTHGGTRMNTYRTFDEDLFSSLTDLVADPSQRLVYALSGNSVFVFSDDFQQEDGA